VFPVSEELDPALVAACAVTPSELIADSFFFSSSAGCTGWPCKSAPDGLKMLANGFPLCANGFPAYTPTH
jgi:hypothetical protein